MKKIKIILFVFFIVAIFMPFFARSVFADEGEVISVAAASSFSYALREIKEGFEAGGNVRVRLIFGSSGLLARQIQGGAPFDVFISANSGFMGDLAQSGAVRADSMRRFATGALVLAIRNEAGGVEVRGLDGLLDKNIRRVAIANPDHAPYGRAAVEAMKKAGLFEKIRKKLVYGENVRQALQFVESGNVTAGFIALSIAPPSPERAGRRGIRVLSIDQSLYNPIEQTVAVVRSTRHGRSAREFIDYLTGSHGQKVLEKYGFIAP